METTGIDHFVVYARDVDATCEFYETLGLERHTFADDRVALRCGDQKINLHQAGAEYDPHAGDPAPGSADFCLLVETPIEDVVDELDAAGIEVIEGPVPKTGALGPMTSVYVRDPDGNLVELARYDEGVRRPGRIDRNRI
jgi:catechol 2,3-dioxygenase-like lactoylglutathione lyase family enzyme